MVNLSKLELTIKLPKFIKIQNTRLALLQYALISVVVVLMASMMYANRQYLITSVEFTVSTKPWAETGDSYEAKVQDEMTNADFCTKPNDFTYRLIKISPA